MTGDTNLAGRSGGSWTAETHTTLYDGNLNTGLGDFIVEILAPTDMMEFGSGVGSLANYLAERLNFTPSFCIEPEIAVPVGRNLNLLNVDVLADPAPKVLDRRFDMVLSIEVAEHVPHEKHEALFDFLVARAGRWIVFSGARPGQGGHGHVAERPELEWREEFVSRGCIFDPRFSALARTYCNQKNINHRQNVQIFRAPERSAALTKLEDAARPYLADLLTIVENHAKSMTGGLFYVDLAGAQAMRPEHSLHWKRENLTALAARAECILEVGFAAGHSALLCLLSNPSSHLTIVDPMALPYAQPCFDYLARVFPGRLTLKQGLSPDILPRLEPRAFDLIHLDGGKEATIESDLDQLRPLAAPYHTLIIDDTQNAALNAVVAARETEGVISGAAFAKMNARAERSRWTHRICRFSDGEIRLDDALRRMRALYEDSDIASIYTNLDDRGYIVGLPRAKGLVAAICDVEERGLAGAFVEVGVAAGHSSVIAALAASPHMPRDFYLYDTFAGFSDDLPDEADMDGVSIRAYDLGKYRDAECGKPMVERRMRAAGISRDRLMMLQGPAEATIPRIQPPDIAILRLDADLFDPTYTALTHLYDRIQPSGWLIIDDYGHWKGCKEAVDKFFAERGGRFEAEAWDYTCYAMKTPVDRLS